MHHLSLSGIQLYFFILMVVLNGACFFIAITLAAQLFKDSK